MFCKLMTKIFYSCRLFFIIFYIVCGLLAVATTFSNVTVLIVFFTNKKLMSGQAVYRISLAIANFIVRIIIFPTFITSNIKHIQEVLFLQFYSFTPYVDIVGFFLVLSYHATLFTLISATIDRFRAVYRPWKYDLKSSIFLAQKICSGIWIISITLAIIPFGYLDKSFRYMIFNGTFVMPVTLKSINVHTYYSIFAILIPLIIMWIFTILTFVFYAKYSKQRREIISEQGQRTEMIRQFRLLPTIGIMTGIFSICSLPTVFANLLLLLKPSQSNPSVNVSVVVILMTNSLWNFIIYCTRDRLFWKATKDVCKQFL